eukprot:48910-Rhodomonas_salina.1
MSSFAHDLRLPTSSLVRRRPHTRSVTEARWGKGSVVGDRWGHVFESVTEAHGGNFQLLVGQKHSLSNIDGPSNGSLTAACRDCFGKGIPPLGQPIKNWWD